MSEKKEFKHIVTPEFRAAFPQVFEAKANKLNPNGPPQFSIVMLFPKTTDLSGLRAMAKQAVINKWGEDPAKWPKNLRSPFRDGDEQQKWDGYAGTIFVRAATQMAVPVIGPSKLPVTDKTKVYGGVYARASVSAWAYAHSSGNCGVSFNLLALQLIRDGAAFANRVDPDKEFSALEEAANSSESPEAYAGAEKGDPFA